MSLAWALPGSSRRAAWACSMARSYSPLDNEAWAAFNDAAALFFGSTVGSGAVVVTAVGSAVATTCVGAAVGALVGAGVESAIVLPGPGLRAKYAPTAMTAASPTPRAAYSAALDFSGSGSMRR